MASVNSFTDYGFLKRMYSGVIRTSLNNDLPLYSRLEDVLDQVNIGGAGLYWGVRMGRHHGTHAIGEDATISTPTRATEKQAAATPAEVWGQAQLTAKVMAMAKNSADAFEPRSRTRCRTSWSRPSRRSVARSSGTRSPAMRTSGSWGSWLAP